MQPGYRLPLQPLAHRCHMTPVKPESPAHAAHTGSRYANLVDAVALYVE